MAKKRKIAIPAWLLAETAVPAESIFPAANSFIKKNCADWRLRIINVPIPLP